MAGTHPLRLLLTGALLLLWSMGCTRNMSLVGPAAAPTAPAAIAGTSAFTARGGCTRGGDQIDSPQRAQWCVQVRAGVDAEAVAADHGLELEKYLPDAGLAVVEAPEDPDALRADPRVLHAEANQPVAIDDPLDMLMGFHQGQWDDGSLQTQQALASLQLPELLALAGGAGIKIAILDTGADAEHPLLEGHILANGKFLGLAADERANGRDDDGDGRIDEAFGHGTHLAGVLATIAPSAEILPLGVLNDDGAGTEFNLAVGLRLARLWGARVVNLSLRMEGHSAIVADGLARLRADGAVILVAAGNQPGESLPYPASDPNVIPVAATDLGDVLASFSASGGALLAAPGVHVESCYPLGRWAWASGTSMACAVAAGSLATVASVLGPTSMENSLVALRLSAVPVPDAPGLLGGRVAPLAAAQAMLRITPSAPGPPELHPTAMNGAQL